LKTYDPVDYWTTLHSRDDLSSVGQQSLPADANVWLYRILTRNLANFCAQQSLLDPAPTRALDIGAGTGHWVRFWRERGIETVDGLDLVPEAVQRLEERLADGRSRFYVGDISDSSFSPQDSYELVSCMNVLLHITDESNFDIALRNLASTVAPGGTLLLCEPILRRPGYERPYDAAQTSRARRLERYRGGLEAAGLTLEALRPATVLANNPMEAVSPWTYKLLWAWWIHAAVRLGEDLRGRAVGQLMTGLDAIAMHTGAAPSSKFALFRRRSDGT
jgi:SAM-dependent methyltransferase